MNKKVIVSAGVAIGLGAGLVAFGILAYGTLKDLSRELGDPFDFSELDPEEEFQYTRIQYMVVAHRCAPIYQKLPVIRRIGSFAFKALLSPFWGTYPKPRRKEAKNHF